MGTLNYKNLPWWVTKVELYKEVHSNGILWKIAFQSSMLTHLAHVSCAQYYLVSLS